MADPTGMPIAKAIHVGEIYIYKSMYAHNNVVRVTEVGERNSTPWNEGPRVWGYWYGSIEEAKEDTASCNAERLFCYWDGTNLYETKRVRIPSGFSKFIQKVEHV